MDLEYASATLRADVPLQPTEVLLLPIRTCVVIPAYNEELAIERTIDDYRAEFPEALIVVIDNNSSDQTRKLAAAKLESGGGCLLSETRQGKGAAIKAGLSRIDAEIYVMADGDGTYLAADARRLVDTMLRERCDMVVGDRISGGTYMAQNTRAGHSAGNKFLTKYISSLAGQRYADVLSGLRVMSRPFVSALDIRSSGFQLETELNIVAAYMRAKVVEMPIAYLRRPEGSESKLNTIRDGFHITWFAALNWIAFYPLSAFGILAVAALSISALLGTWVIYVFLSTGLLPYPSTALAAAVAGLVGLQSLFTGMSLRVTGRTARRRDVARMVEMRRTWNARLDSLE